MQYYPLDIMLKCSSIGRAARAGRTSQQKYCYLSLSLSLFPFHWGWHGCVSSERYTSGSVCSVCCSCQLTSWASMRFCSALSIDLLGPR